MKRPGKAIVLAAGFGTRMRPLTCGRPKPLLPVWGRSMLDSTVRLLSAWGVREILINLHHLPHAILDHVRSANYGVSISFSYEPEILGTGGALQKARWFMNDEHLWIINADVAADLKPEPLLAAWRHKTPLAAVWLTDTAGPRTVEVNSGKITTFRSARRGLPGTYTLCGLHLISPDILKYIPPSGASSIVDAYESAGKDGHFIAPVVVPDSFWADIGSPQNYLDTHKRLQSASRSGERGSSIIDRRTILSPAELKRKGVKVEGFAAIARTARIERNTVVRDSVVWDNALIAAGSELSEAIVANHTAVKGKVEGVAQAYAPNADPDVDLVMSRLSWPPARTTVNLLPARGSARSFTRMSCGSRSCIVVAYDPARFENTLYAGHARFLRDLDIPVPGVIVDLPARNILAIDDLGSTSLLDLCGSLSAHDVISIYMDVLRPVTELHERGAAAARKAGIRLAEPFSRKLYRWERDLFATFYLEKRLHLTPRRIAGICRELEGVSARLLRRSPALIHRDLQSSNILICGGEPFFIDFQGMRLGHPLYDIASLLCDPYVSLSEALKESLLAFYVSERRLNLDETRDELRWATVQRLAQALGAFGRMSLNPDTARFSRHILPALSILQRAIGDLRELPCLQDAIWYAVGVERRSRK